jgi:hypothetical protein
VLDTRHIRIEIFLEMFIAREVLNYRIGQCRGSELLSRNSSECHVLRGSQDFPHINATGQSPTNQSLSASTLSDSAANSLAA